MGQVIKILGGLWAIIGVLFMLLAFSSAAVMPEAMATMAGIWATITFVVGFLVPGGMMYCVGDLHHQLIAKKED